MTEKFRRALAQLPYLPRALALVWAAARRWTVAWAVLLVVQGLLPVATVTLTRSLVDSLVAGLGAGASWANFRPTLLLAILMAGIMTLGELLRSAAGWVRTAQAELVKDHIHAQIHKQSIAVDLAFYEMPDYYDRLHRARNDARYRPLALLESMGSLLQNGITLVGMVGVLVPYSFWLPVALVFSTFPAFYAVLRHQRRHHQWWLRTTANERRAWYYDWLLTARESAAELRLFGLGDQFRATYQALRCRLREERLRLGRDEGLTKLVAGGFGLLVTGGAMAWMVLRVLQGTVTLGDLALFYQAFNRGQGLARSLLENLGQIYGNSLFLRELFEFLTLEPQVVDPASPALLAGRLGEEVRGPGIRFKNVTFRYPGSRRAAVQNLDLTIPAECIAAIVGPNGAGKSTLVKLLCRFYDPQAGSIEMDGIDLRDISVAQVRRRITVLFQEPVRYNATVGENIALDGPGAAPVEIKAAAEAAQADSLVTRLPDGYDTLLGKWFEGGTDLSAGEWQRIALARACFRRAPLILLDEPTGAMDAWAEADWLGSLRHLAAGRTAVIITHRFTTAIHADVIYVMEDGRVVESGSHEELLALGGRYAQSWEAQVGSAERGAGERRRFTGSGECQAAGERVPDAGEQVEHSRSAAQVFGDEPAYSQRAG